MPWTVKPIFVRTESSLNTKSVETKREKIMSSKYQQKFLSESIKDYCTIRSLTDFGQ